MADVTVIGWDSLLGKMFDIRRQTCESDLLLGDYAFTRHAVAVLREKLVPTPTPLPDDEQQVLDEYRAEKKEREAVAAAEARIKSVMANGLLERADFPLEKGTGRWSDFWVYYLKAKGSSCLTPDGFFHSTIKSEAAEAAAEWAEELKPEKKQWRPIEQMDSTDIILELLSLGYEIKKNPNSDYTQAVLWKNGQKTTICFSKQPDYLEDALKTARARYDKEMGS